MPSHANLDLDRKPAPAGAECERSAWERGDSIPWERDLLTLFARNQIKVFWALPLLALLYALASLAWVPIVSSLSWLLAVVGCHAIQAYLCKDYLSKPTSSIRYADWLGMLCAAETLIAACWSALLFVHWDAASSLEHLYIIATLMAVIAVRIMIAANFMPVIVAGTGFMTFNIVIRCILEAQPLYLALGVMAFGLEIFFIQLSVRLQQTARDMLIFKAQREQLIHELREEKERAEAARQKAEEASKAKSQFLATMSHELRTPLNAILGFSEIIGREMFGPHHVEAYKDYATDIHASGNYLLALINDILDLSRIEAGRRELEDAPLSVSESIGDAVHLVHSRARAKGLKLTVDVAANLPRILADRRALQQIWLNLLSNAVKFTPDGGSISIEAQRDSMGAIAVSVKDTGPGIPEHEIDLALRTYSRGAYATKQAIDGAGLGLPIVNGLIRLHGGQLTIRGSNGNGTEIIITIPCKRVLDGPRGEILAAPTVETGSQRKLISLTG